MTELTILEIDFKVSELLKKQSEAVDKATNLLFSMPYSEERQALIDAYHDEVHKLGVQLQQLFELRSQRLMKCVKSTQKPIYILDSNTSHKMRTLFRHPHRPYWGGRIFYIMVCQCGCHTYQKCRISCVVAFDVLARF